MRPSSPALLAAILLLTASARAQNDDVEIPALKPAAPAPPIAPAPATPPAATAAPPVVTTTPTAVAGTDVEALRSELARIQAALDARIRDLDARLAATTPAAAPASLTASLLPSDFAISAYVQAQYESHQDSQDQIQQGGSYLNQDRFSIRRGRVRFDAAWRFAELALELDGNTSRGPSFGLRRAEATLVWRGPKMWDHKIERRADRENDPPPIALTFGLTEIPFGQELIESARERVFAERSQGSLAFFPGEPDLGVRVSGGLGFFRYSVAILNGEPLDDRAGGRGGRDPNGAKDLVARLGADARPTSSTRIAGGVSVLRGQGFHQGSDATKNGVQWRDTNENSLIDPGEITASPGAAATPSQSFPRWAFGADLRLRAKTWLGWSTLYGEVALASNLDRGLFVADPITTGVDVRELSYYAALVQEITPYALAGLRFDTYDPNADFFDKRQGKLVPTSQAIHTFSPLIGVALPTHARLIFQYDVVRDLLAKDARGVPVDLRNDRWTLRLQVSL
jgi:hypothetical protein